MLLALGLRVSLEDERLPVFVVFEPTVGVEVVDEHGEGDEDEGGSQGSGVAGDWEGVGDADAEGDATLPCEHIGALGGAALTMATEFDEEQEKTGTDEADGDAYQGGSDEVGGCCGTYHQQEEGCQEQDKATDNLTLEFCITEDKTTG